MLELVRIFATCIGKLWHVLHGHGKSSLLRVGAGEGHPSDVERMREGSERLRPHDTKVSHAADIDLGEDAVEDVAE